MITADVRSHNYTDLPLYYIHSFIPVTENTEEYNDKANYQVVLIPAFEDRDFEGRILRKAVAWTSNGDFIVHDENAPNHSMSIYEGAFVGVVGNDLINLNTDPRAMALRFVTNRLRGNLLKFSVTETRGEDCVGVYSVRSYHVNVGHGNTSIIAFKCADGCNFWLVDCAARELLTYHDYSANILSCLNHIGYHYGVDKPSISKIFVTHTHYDHISGLSFLFENGYVDSHAEIWINLKFAASSATYNKLLKHIKSGRNYSIIDPVVRSSNKNVCVLYPTESFTGTRKGTARMAPKGKYKAFRCLVWVSSESHLI